MRVRHGGIESQRDTDRLRRALRFRGAGGRITAGAHFALRQVEYADAMSRAHSPGECSTTGELDVVAMRSDREQVHLFTPTGVPRLDRASPRVPRVQYRRPGRR